MNKRLTEIELIRPFFIILLVLYHAFIIFAGGWAPVYGYEDIPAYRMIAGVSYGFMLEGFVLMSGYIYGYQAHKNGLVSFFKLAKKKTLRLLVPAWIWSLIYGVTLLPYPFSLIELISGIGHLWFLVMLFWVFIGAWLINKLELPQSLIWSILVLFALLSDNPLPFQLSNAMYYLLFFYLGEKLFDWISEPKNHLSKCTTPQLLINGGGISCFLLLKSC